MTPLQKMKLRFQREKLGNLCPATSTEALECALHDAGILEELSPFDTHGRLHFGESQRRMEDLAYLLELEEIEKREAASEINVKKD